jgi:transposase
MTDGRGDEAAMIAAAVAGKSFGEIAAAGGVSVSTAQRRLKNPEVAGLVQEGRTEQRRQLIGRLNELAQLSMERLEELVTQEEPGVAVRAISLVLSSSQQLARVVELDERIRLIEQQIGGQQ